MEPTAGTTTTNTNIIDWTTNPHVLATPAGKTLHPKTYGGLKAEKGLSPADLLMLHVLVQLADDKQHAPFTYKQLSYLLATDVSAAHSGVKRLTRVELVTIISTGRGRNMSTWIDLSPLFTWLAARG